MRSQWPPGDDYYFFGGQCEAGEETDCTFDCAPVDGPEPVDDAELQEWEVVTGDQGSPYCSLHGRPALPKGL